MNEQEKSEAIEDIKTFVAMAGVAKTELQREILSKQAEPIRRLLEELFPTKQPSQPDHSLTAEDVAVLGEE